MGEGRVTLRDTKVIVDDPKHLRRAQINRMFVDESGDHCFLVSDTALFYNHWGSDQIKRIDLLKAKYFAERDLDFAFKISCIAIKVIEDELFEVLLGTSTGHILHGCILSEP